jgi:uncharacterized membrane protein YdcZ (DUF606 family)
MIDWIDWIGGLIGLGFYFLNELVYKRDGIYDFA